MFEIPLTDEELAETLWKAINLGPENYEELNREEKNRWRLRAQRLRSEIRAAVAAK